MRPAKNAAVHVLRPRAASSSGSLHLAAPFCGPHEEEREEPRLLYAMLNALVLRFL